MRRQCSKAAAAAIALLIIVPARAQFTPGILANDSYWSDGKAEFNIYDAELMRRGQARRCEVLHILFRERVDSNTLARIDDLKRADAIAVVRMQQMWNMPIGLFVEQGSLAAYWRVNPVAVAQLNFVGSDSFGNVANRLEQKEGWNLLCQTYRAKTSTLPVAVPSGAVFADELPLRVRTIDFTKPPAEFELQLGSSIIGIDKPESVQFATAKVSWKPVEKAIEVTVQQANARSHFLLDRDFPFLLREWSMPDGSKLKLKRDLKADYWNYGRNGDRERALKNPMLQHPD